MHRENEQKEKNEPQGIIRDAFLKGLVEIINEEYNLPLKFVRRECDRGNQNEIIDVL